MKYSVPNAPVVSYLDQAEPDDFDFQALGDRRTGIVQGGEVTALGSPAASVQVASGIAVIADEPLRFSAGTVAVANGGGNPRFDIIAVSKTGVLTNIAGASSANALFTNFDFASFAPLAAVYVPAGSTSVLGSHISLKAASMANKFSRTYSSPNSTFLQSQVTTITPSLFTVMSDGQLYWDSSTLRRTAVGAMQWITSLVMKAIGVDSGAPVLILQSTDSVPANQKLLQTTSAGGSETAYINGAGQLYADNLKFGTGNPNGSVVGKKGDLFISRNNGGTSTGIWQKGGVNGTDTDWESFRIFSSSESALPTGTIIHSLKGTAPDGFIPANGQWISVSDPITADLAAVIGSRYGSQPGEIKMPDLRGLTLSGSGNGLPVFENVGTDELTLSRDNMPVHSHTVNDPGHEHPQAGPYAYIMPWQFHNNRHPVPSDSALEHIYTESTTFDKNARTGITLNTAGSSEPISMYQPTHPVHLYVKL